MNTRPVQCFKRPGAEFGLGAFFAAQHDAFKRFA